MYFIYYTRHIQLWAKLVTVEQQQSHFGMYYYLYVLWYYTHELFSWVCQNTVRMKRCWQMAWLSHTMKLRSRDDKKNHIKENQDEIKWSLTNFFSDFSSSSVCYLTVFLILVFRFVVRFTNRFSALLKLHATQLFPFFCILRFTNDFLYTYFMVQNLIYCYCKNYLESVIFAF